ncbi:MAG TPA: hypothetical protein VGO80_18775 [Solirubrobacteraceae bacterium]|nr:hypothetical protein [Solirubrobacteraceae bacterium]
MGRLCARTILVAAALVAFAALPAAATAKITDMGALSGAVRPGCPLNCQALTRSTGYQAKVGPDRGLYQAPADGRIVSWTIALGKPAARDVAIFRQRYGGEPLAAIVVLDAGKKLSRTVVAKAPPQQLSAHLGQTVEFPLVNTLAIKKGQYVALTVPTWAPALQTGLGADTSWRSSRDPAKCLDTTTQFGLLGSRASTFFRCLYKGVRVTYSATFISNPTETPTK